MSVLFRCMRQCRTGVSVLSVCTPPFGGVAERLCGQPPLLRARLPGGYVGRSPYRSSLAISHRCLATTAHGGTKQGQNAATGRPDDGVVVYRGTLSNQMRYLKVFSLFTSGIGVFAGPTVVAQMSKAGMGIAIMMGSIMGIFTLMTPFMIHMVVRNYVTEMSYSQTTDLYTATTITLFLQKRKVTFGADDVQVPTVPGMFTTFHAKGRALFTDPSSYEPVEHYGRLMGYHRPIDYMLEQKKDQGDSKQR